MAGSLPLKNDVQLVTQLTQSRRQVHDSGVLLKWRWVYAKGRGEGPEGTLLIYDH